jgi:hypothetical protein
MSLIHPSQLLRKLLLPLVATEPAAHRYDVAAGITVLLLADLASAVMSDAHLCLAVPRRGFCAFKDCAHVAVVSQPCSTGLALPIVRSNSNSDGASWRTAIITPSACSLERK